MKVAFCCNDEHGMSLNIVEEVIFGDFDLKLERDGSRRPPAFGYWAGRRKVRVGRRFFAASQYRTHVGNIFWDEVEMADRDAYDVAAYLLMEKGFRAREYALDTAFARLVKSVEGH